ncbi:MAG: hypothetical protein AB1405_15570 [Bdellovibrionota bacterium]
MTLSEVSQKILGRPEVVRGYVNFMLGFMSRGIVAASQEDKTIQEEVAGFPAGFEVELQTLPDGPGMRLRKTPGNELALVTEGFWKKPTLAIQFKHLQHAWRVLTFQENTARAFANNRMIVDGEIAYAMRMVRILNRFQAMILPLPVAQKALKRVPQIPEEEKKKTALAIYTRLARNALRRS